MLWPKVKKGDSSCEATPVAFASWLMVGMPGIRSVESFLVKTVCFCIMNVLVNKDFCEAKMNVLFDLGFFARSAKLSYV